MTRCNCNNDNCNDNCCNNNCRGSKNTQGGVNGRRTLSSNRSSSNKNSKNNSNSSSNKNSNDSKSVNNSKSVNKSLNNSKPHKTKSLKINGVNFNFPCVPYPSQILTVSKIVDSIRNAASCAIEAPTGSGKSLSIGVAVGGYIQYLREGVSSLIPTQVTHNLSENLNKNNNLNISNNLNINIRSNNSNKNESYKNSPSLLNKLLDKNCSNSTQQISPNSSVNVNNNNNSVNNNSTPNTKNEFTQFPTNPTKFIIASRTHKQLDQLVQTFKGTSYTAKSVVLAGRNVLCVNRRVNNSVNKKSYADINTECRDTIKRNECIYWTNKDRGIKKMMKVFNLDVAEQKKNINNSNNIISSNSNLNFDAIRESIHSKNIFKGKESVFDIEESIRLNKTCKACPYFSIRSVVQYCDIIYMPYSYLLDESIRKSLDIEWSRTVCIIDEAHNIEDVLCDSGSVSFTQTSMIAVKQEISTLAYKFNEESTRKSLMVLNYFIKHTDQIADIVLKNYHKEVDPKEFFTNKRDKSVNLDIPIDLERVSQERGDLNNKENKDTQNVYKNSQSNTSRSKDSQNNNFISQNNDTQQNNDTLKNNNNSQNNNFSSQNNKNSQNNKDSQNNNDTSKNNNTPINNFYNQSEDLFQNLTIKREESEDKFDYILKGKSVANLLNQAGITMEMINKLANQSEIFSKSSDLNQNISLGTLQFVESLMKCVKNLHFLGAAYGLILTLNKKQNQKMRYKKTKIEDLGLDDIVPDRMTYKIQLVLLDPAIELKSLKFHSLILMSGTLAPFDVLQSELRHSFKYTLVAPSVFKLVPSKEPNDKKSSSSDKIVTSKSSKNDSVNVMIRQIKKIGNLDMKLSYGWAKGKVMDGVIQIIMEIRNKLMVAGQSTGKGAGTVVFLPSYAAVQTVYYQISSRTSELRENGFTAGDLFTEKADSFDEVFQMYSTKCKRSFPILLAVYRGKSSEGTDFKDELARAVICVGMPYPNIKDHTVTLHRTHKPKWYETQCYRALNQAIGRVCRWKGDWGGVFLVDQRVRLEGLSKWVKDAINSNQKTGEWAHALTDWRNFLFDKN